MAERRDDAGFALEARKRLRVVGETLGKNLDRDVALQPRVPGAIHLAHSAGAERREHLIGSEPRADSVWHPSRRDYRASRPPAEATDEVSPKRA